MGDVGDGDADDMAAGVARVRIGHGVHGVVVVLGVGRIDGDERHIAPILAALVRRRPGSFRFGDRPRGQKRAECRERGSRSG